MHALRLPKHVNSTSNTCFQDRKVNVSTWKGAYFVQISAFLLVVCLLIFSILKILNGRFLVKEEDKNNEMDLSKMVKTIRTRNRKFCWIGNTWLTHLRTFFFFSFKTNKTNQLSKTMNASVLRMKQIWRQKRVMYLC